MQYPGRDAFKFTFLRRVFKRYFEALFTLIKKECETEFIQKHNSTSPVKPSAIINWPLVISCFWFLLHDLCYIFQDVVNNFPFTGHKVRLSETENLYHFF